MLETQGGVSEQNKKSSNSSSNSQNENLVTANNRRNRQNVEQVQEQEMGLKQFSTITDLLIKLKGNLSKYLGYFIILSMYLYLKIKIWQNKIINLQFSQKMGLKEFSTFTDLLIKLEGYFSKYLVFSSFYRFKIWKHIPPCF